MEPKIAEDEEAEVSLEPKRSEVNEELLVFFVPSIFLNFFLKFSSTTTK